MNFFRNITLFFALILASSAPAQNNIAQQKKLLYGTWVFQSGSGGLTGKGPGWTKGSVSYEFKKNGKMSRIEKGKPVEKGKFTCSEKKSLTEGEVQPVLVFTKGIEQTFVVRNDSLFLNENVHDGFSYVFTRRKKS